jgi:hypothetical protein
MHEILSLVGDAFFLCLRIFYHRFRLLSSEDWFETITDCFATSQKKYFILNRAHARKIDRTAKSNKKMQEFTRKGAKRKAIFSPRRWKKVSEILQKRRFFCLKHRKNGNLLGKITNI